MWKIRDKLQENVTVAGLKEMMECNDQRYHKGGESTVSGSVPNCYCTADINTVTYQKVCTNTGCVCYRGKLLLSIAFGLCQ